MPRAADAEYLTEALRRSGALGDGRVGSVVVESDRPTLLSRIIRLRLTYEGDATGAPNSLILKTAQTGGASAPPGSARTETAFYMQVAVATPPGLVPRCFDAVCAEDAKTWHLLLEDLTDSHVSVGPWPLPPTLPQCQNVTRARSRFHAAWWDDPRLGVSIGTGTDDDAMAQYLLRFGDKLEGFCDRVGDRLPRERRDLYEQLIAAAPQLSERYYSNRNLTIVHGDAHFWNCLLPRDGGADVKLFDWDS